MTELITKWPIALHTMPAGNAFCHAYATIYGPTSANPLCSTRFALPGACPGDSNTRAAFYLADSPISALWEVVLRGVRSNGNGQIYLALAEYAGRSVVTLTAKRDIPLVMRVDKPRRYRLVDNESVGDLAWDICCTSPVHAISHGAAHAVNRYLAERGIQHAGIGWKSRHYQDETVYVLYSPPFDEDDWEVGEIVDLTSARGIALLQDAVEAAGFTWINCPADAPVEAEVAEV